jgi:hypothetical protein
MNRLWLQAFDDLAGARDQQLALRAADRALIGAGVTDWATRDFFHLADNGSNPCLKRRTTVTTFSMTGG